jgi:serine O-acetyltransferase
MERLYYLSNWFYRRGVPVLPRLMMVLIRLLYQSFIPYQVSIGPGVSFGHRQGIVIARTARIGARCVIRHQVTIANSPQGAAMIGDDVQIGAGAKLIGRVTIGDRARIGANAVVVRDVPADVTVAGVPARIVKHHSLQDANDRHAEG